ncbi:MAG: hydroxymethylbilane synthase [Planctomycetes bacterium]|nr:hydroxymethylbilane synthase [Planctomycetota bacterium]
MKKVRIGTRGSELALWQARHTQALLAACGVESELVVLKTRGDLIDNVPLQQVEGKAFFTAEIENALLEERVDLAVHSHKDLPTENTPGLVIGAVPERGPQGERLLIAPAAHDPRGAFVPLKRGARVGTSAPRRNEQLVTLRPDLEVLDLRGNVPTRVRRLQEGRYDAIVLACAGLDRLKLDIGELVAFDLPADVLAPAPAQGALALQVRAADAELLALCRERLHHEPTAQAVEAERSLLVTSGGGCSLPLAAAVWLDRRRPQSPPPQNWGTNGAAGGGARTPSDLRQPPASSGSGSTAIHVAAAASTGSTANSNSAATTTAPAAEFIAHTFLGAGHPASRTPRARFPRWAVGRGATPQAAIEAARAQLDSGAATGWGPLAGLRVALAGSASDGSVLGERLGALGAHVALEKLLEFEALPGVDLRAHLAALRAGDVLALTSRQAARSLAGAQLPPGVTLAAVGPACARALEELGLRADVVGHGGGEALAARLTLASGASVLWPCAEDALPDFSTALEQRGVAVRRVPVYRTRTVRGVELHRDVDARVYMSPSAVEAALDWERANTRAAAQRFALGHATAAALAQARLDAVAPTCESGPITEALVAELWRRYGRQETHA